MIKLRFRIATALALSAIAAAAVPVQAADTKKHAAKHHAKHHSQRVEKKSKSAAGAQPAAATRPAAPATPAAEQLGSAGGWTAYTAGDAAGKVCYLVGKPEKSEPGGGRKPPMAMVTHRPAESVANVVSFVEGYPLKDGSDVALAVGDHKFELFTKDDSAWARTSELDRSIVAALAKGKRAVVKGQPQKGPTTTDIYPLNGFPKALALIDKACGVKR
ncbi:MAG TPA: invasion associated locus B family protein [Stellaceae bacterium]